jgi:hypothetical protein
MRIQGLWNQMMSDLGPPYPIFWWHPNKETETGRFRNGSVPRVVPFRDASLKAEKPSVPAIGERV